MHKSSHCLNGGFHSKMTINTANLNQNLILQKYLLQLCTKSSQPFHFYYPNFLDNRKMVLWHFVNCTRSYFWTVTFHKTFFQESSWSKPPCAEMVEKRVWPALFLTAGLPSTHKSPRRENKHIHRASNDDIPSEFSLTLTTSSGGLVSSSALIRARFW